MKKNALGKWLDKNVGIGKKYRTKSAFARDIGVTYQSLINYEHGNPPKRIVAARIREKTGLTLEELGY